MFLLLKCNVYLKNSISVLNSNSLSHIECQSVLQELLWCLWKQFFSNEKTYYVTGTGSQGRLPTTLCLWVIWPQTQLCVNLSCLRTFSLVQTKLRSILERTFIKTMPQSKVKPLVTAWIGFKKINVFLLFFLWGWKWKLFFSDFQVLTTEWWCNINFFTSLGLLACLKLCVLKHIFELMLCMVPTTSPHREQAWNKIKLLFCNWEI